MTHLEKHCVSLELAKQLKESGWKKETEFWWEHSHPKQFEIFWFGRLGKEKFDALETRARYVAPVKELDLLLINYDLKNQLKSLQA